MVWFKKIGRILISQMLKKESFEFLEIFINDHIFFQIFLSVSLENSKQILIFGLIWEWNSPIKVFKEFKKGEERPWKIKWFVLSAEKVGWFQCWKRTRQIKRFLFWWKRGRISWKRFLFWWNLERANRRKYLLAFEVILLAGI